MSLPGGAGTGHDPRASGRRTREEAAIEPAERASVSTYELRALKRSVEWVIFLDTDSSASDFLDPCCMLEALSEVYNAAHRLVDESNQWRAGLASGSTPRAGCEYE